MTNYECENRISDDEIISSLEVIATTRNCSECKICNCNWGDCNCSQITANAALGIINRQKTEIERLKSELSNTRRKALLEAYSKFEGHSDYHGDTILCKLICMSEGKEVGTATPLDMSEIKVKAYKKFAEHLKERWSNNDYDSPDVDFDEFVDNLLKENEKGR